jgi:hypothetical protein
MRRSGIDGHVSMSIYWGKCQLRRLGALGVLVNHIIESKELN